MRKEMDTVTKIYIVKLMYPPFLKTSTEISEAQQKSENESNEENKSQRISTVNDMYIIGNVHPIKASTCSSAPTTNAWGFAL